MARPMSPLEREVAQRDVDSIYHTFKGRVASGRKLAPATVDSLAQGRVWSGTAALRVGLVDRIGGLQDAIACAARMAKLDKYSLREYPKHPSFFDKLMSKSEDSEAGSMQVLEKHLSPQHASWLRSYQSLYNMANSPQARLPFILQLP
jgi:protease-4